MPTWLRVRDLVYFVVLILLLLSIRSTFDSERAEHATYCRSKIAYAQTSQNFWYATYEHRKQHAALERVAARFWDSLPKPWNGHAVVWRQLAADDEADAQTPLAHLQDLQRDFDDTCGNAPTPEPK